MIHMGCAQGASQGAPSAISAGGELAYCGGCPAQPPMRRWFLADRIPASTRAALGTQVMVDLGSIPAVDSKGRFAHVLGFYFDGQYRFVGDTTNSAINGRDLLAVWSNVFLEDVSGHQYAAAIDGRNIRDDQFFRNFVITNYSTPMPIAANQNGNLDRFVSMYWPLIRTDRRNGGDYAGAISLAALQAKVGALRFTVAASQDTVLGVTTGLAAPSGFQGTLLVYVDVVYLPTMLITMPWTLEDYAFTDLSGSLRHADRYHEYVALRHKVGDTGGEDVADYGALTVSVNGDIIISALAQAEMKRRDQFIVSSDALAGSLSTAGHASANDPGGETADNTAFAQLWKLPLTETTSDAAMLVIPQSRSFDAMPAGQVGYQFASRSTHTLTRFLHRTVSCHDRGRVQEILRSTGCREKIVFAGLDQHGKLCRPSPLKTLAAVPESTAKQLNLI